MVGSDAVNAYAQSPTPQEPTYVGVDPQNRDWYLKKNGVELDFKLHVLPVKHDLQGHPELGTLWANKIEGHLKELGFKSTTQETCLYWSIYQGQEVICSRQIDDFMFSSEFESTIRVPYA